MKKIAYNFIALSLVVIVISANAAGLSVPNTFTSGTPAVAAEVNDNFTAVMTAIGDNDSKIAALEAALATLQSTVASQASIITTLQGDLDTANSSINTLQSSLAAKADKNHNHDAIYSSISHNHTGVYAPVNHSHAQSDITGLTSSLNTHTSQISAINNSNVMDLDAYLTVSTTGGAKATLSGINLQIVNGMGSTGTINGLGNLIIGYDEVNTNTTVFCSDGKFFYQSNCEGTGETWSNSQKTGSHYLVLGTENNYSQYGGLVAGYRNTVNRNYSTITGGRENIATGSYSSVSGGMLNQVYGHYGSISGGRENVVSVGSAYSSVTGGLANYARGSYSTVSGGMSNWSSGSYSTVSGGRNHRINGSYDWQAGSLFEEQ